MNAEKLMVQLFPLVGLLDKHARTLHRRSKVDNVDDASHRHGPVWLHIATRGSGSRHSL
jgi:hypothetical protein